MQAVSPQEVTAAVGVCGALLAGLNVLLTLRLRVATLEQEARILAQVKCEYRARETCELLMQSLRAELAAGDVG